MDPSNFYVAYSHVASNRTPAGQTFTRKMSEAWTI